MLIGNLTRDPELRYIPSGSAVASFSLAMNRVYKLQTGEKKEEVSFVKVIVWGRMAEVCGEYLTKGSPVFVEGRLQSRSWDGPDGQKRSALEVIAVNIQFLRGQQSGPAKERGLPIEAVQSSGKEEIPDIQLEEYPEGSKAASDETPF
jgi:single-strand DNA-binding protein